MSMNQKIKNLIHAPKSYKPEHSLKGEVTLSDVSRLEEMYFGVFDISEAEFGYEEEKWAQVLGYRHGGCAVIGNSGTRRVEVLQRFLENVRAHTIILPNDVKRRHINTLLRHKNVRVVKVLPDCQLFAMDGDKVTNKAGTRIIFDPELEATLSDVSVVYAMPNPMSDAPDAYWIADTSLKMQTAITAKSKGRLSKAISISEKSERPGNMNNPVLSFIASPLSAVGIPFSSQDVADVLESLGYEVRLYEYSYFEPSIQCVCIKPDILKEIFDVFGYVVKNGL